MKKILFVIVCILLANMFVISSFAVDSKIENYSTDPSYKEILSLVDDIVVYANTAINDENREKLYISKNETLPEITKKDVDFSMLCKFYRNATEILNCKTEEEIIAVLETLRHKWVLPIFVNDVVIEITISKTYDFEEGEAEGLSTEEKRALADEKGYYHISSMVLTDDASFWTEATKNGEMTYFVNLVATDAALQIRNNKSYLLCKNGVAAGKYINSDRIEIEQPSPDGTRKGFPTYTLKEPKFPYITVTLSATVAFTVSVVVLVSSKRKKNIKNSGKL